MGDHSATASVIAVVQISGQIFQLCQTYYSEVQDAKNDIQRLRNEVIALRGISSSVNDLIDTEGKKPSALEFLDRNHGLLQNYHSELDKLARTLEKATGNDTMKNFGMKALKWPLDTKEVDNAVEIIEKCKTTFSQALGCDQANLVLAADRSATERKNQVAAYQEDDQRTDICRWLSITDPSSNYEAARKKCQPNTGEWLFQRSEFEEWKKTPNSPLWLYGKSGCGKTILSSTIIRHLKAFCESKVKVALAYFYFDFDDPEKQNPRNFLSSLISQLCMQIHHLPEEVKKLYKRCDNGNRKAAVPELKEVLRHVATTKDLDDIFIIVDALDECPQNEVQRSRDELLDLIVEFKAWPTSKIHLLITSRQELDIEQKLTPLLEFPAIAIQGSHINSDIELYISEQLSIDRKLKKWPSQLKLQIKETLTTQADGMFRWVFCQLHLLKKCRTKANLVKELERLPRTLDEIYARILNNIVEEDQQYARRALIWLAFAIRPLRVEELAEATILDPQATPPIDFEERFIDPPNNMLEILGSLVTISGTSYNSDGDDGVDSPYGTGGTGHAPGGIRLAHFSVKEYLVSEGIQEQATKFSTSVINANLFIMESCIRYIIQYHESPSKTSSPADLEDFPLLEYSCGQWHLHGGMVPLESQEHIEPLVFSLFLSETLLLTWVQVYYPDHLWTKPYRVLPIAKPLYYASDVGFQNVAKMLLEKQSDVDEAAAGFGQTALHRASQRGHVEIVRLLLENQADINKQDRDGWTALHWAVNERNEAVVKQLLERQADVNKQEMDGWTPLCEAVYTGNKAIVKLLLEHQADVNGQDNAGRTALHVAVIRENEAIVELLLEHQADVNKQDNDGWTALYGAVDTGKEEIVKLLMGHQADVGLKTKRRRTALQLATKRGYEEIVRLLSQASNQS